MKKINRILMVIMCFIVIICMFTACNKKTNINYSNEEFDYKIENIENITVRKITSEQKNGIADGKIVTGKEDILKIATIFKEVALYKTENPEVKSYFNTIFTLNFNNGESKSYVLTYDDHYKHRLIIDKLSYKIPKETYDKLNKIYGELKYNEQKVPSPELLK